MEGETGICQTFPKKPEDRKNNRHSIFTFKERRDLEQYFWTEATVRNIQKAVSFAFGVDQSCCLCTPSLAHKWWVEDAKEVSLLDVDTRFAFLPKFRYFDISDPTATDLTPDQSCWRIIVCDPPFFTVPTETLFDAIMYICEGRPEKTRLILSYLMREEAKLLTLFAPFNLKKTMFQIEYACVKPNKWKNYRLYSNIDLPGIKRVR